MRGQRLAEIMTLGYVSEMYEDEIESLSETISDLDPSIENPYRKAENILENIEDSPLDIDVSEYLREFEKYAEFEVDAASAVEYFVKSDKLGEYESGTRGKAKLQALRDLQTLKDDDMEYWFEGLASN